VLTEIVYGRRAEDDPVQCEIVHQPGAAG